MLEVANGRVTKTKIIYVSFLSYNQLKDYLYFNEKQSNRIS
jgi:predicted transcriptional regulator